MNDQSKIICMAMDAFRLCIGKAPHNFSPKEIARFVRNRAEKGT